MPEYCQQEQLRKRLYSSNGIFVVKRRKLDGKASDGSSSTKMAFGFEDVMGRVCQNLTLVLGKSWCKRLCKRFVKHGKARSDANSTPSLHQPIASHITNDEITLLR